MKRFATLLVFLSVFLISSAQEKSLKVMADVYSAYLDKCNSLVEDTATQYGAVEKMMVPIYKNGSEEIIGYVQSQSVDTIWHDVIKPEFRDDYSDKIYSANWFTVSGTSNMVTLADNRIGIGEPISKQVKEFITVERRVTISIKKEKPSMEGFFMFIQKL